MDTSEHQEPDPTEQIAPDGDVVLFVGLNKVSLRVYSQCLCSASKVFSDMFNLHLREDQDEPIQFPREISLPEDDAEAMRLICSILHHRNENVPESLVSEEILQLAVVAYKYDLSVALKHARAQWLKPRGNEDMLDLAHLMAAAFLFGDSDAFADRSLDLIVRYKETYLDLLDDKKISQIIPWKTFYEMAERRTRMRAEISHILLEWAKRGCTCGWGKSHSEQYGFLQLEYGPLKMLDVPLLEIIDKMKLVSTDDMKRTYHYRIWGGYYHEPPSYEDTLIGMLESMGKKASISLDDLRAEFRSRHANGYMT